MKLPKQVKLDAEVINTIAYPVFLTVFIGVGTVFSLSLAWHFANPLIAPIGLIITLFAPFLFARGFRSPFATCAIFRFEPDRFSVDLLERKTGEVKLHTEIPYSDIVSYKAADSAKDDSAFIKLYLRNGQRKQYTLIEQDKGTGENVIDSLAEFVKAYNETQEDTGKIIPMPILLATGLAKYLLAGVTLLLITAIIIQLIYHPVSIPVTIVSGGSLYLIILLQRQRDIEQYERIK